MSQRAREYVRELTSTMVTGRQKALLMAIAEYHSERYGTANISLEALCSDTLIERRNMRKMFKALDSLLEYTPGRGQGNFGQFRFPQLPVEDENERGLKGGNKGVIQTPAIRKDLNQDQIQTYPNPSLPGRESKQLRPLTSRRIQTLNAEIYRLMQDPCRELADAVELACTELLIPSAQAWQVIQAAGLGDAKKRPQQEKQAS